MGKRQWLALHVLYIFISERETNCPYSAALWSSAPHKGLLTAAVTMRPAGWKVNVLESGRSRNRVKPLKSSLSSDWTQCPRQKKVFCWFCFMSARLYLNSLSTVNLILWFDCKNPVHSALLLPIGAQSGSWGWQVSVSKPSACSVSVLEVRVAGNLPRVTWNNINHCWFPRSRILYPHIQLFPMHTAC